MLKHRLLQAADFRGFAQEKTSGEILDNDNLRIAIVRDAQGSLDPNMDLDAITDRKISYLFSTEKVARDGHTVSTPGFDLTGFSANPVFLWAHDSDEPPIGKVIDITRENGVMRGVVDYATADLYPFADMIFRMVKKRFINATSISWLPLEWKFSQDRSRPGGIDFTRQDLLEISQVPVPAQITSIATARAAGIDTSPMVRWAEKVLDGGLTIVLPRAEVEQLRAAAKMPVAARRREATVTTVDLVQPPVKRMFARGLYEVGWLASLLADLANITDWSEWEAEYEGDGSEIPARLKGALAALGQILIDMTTEEVSELLDIEGEDVVLVDVTLIDQTAKTDRQKALLRFANFARAAAAHNARKFTINSQKALPPTAASAIRETVKKWLADDKPGVLVLDQGLTLSEITTEEARPLRAIIEARVRAGRVLSAANEQALREACDRIEAVLNQVAAETEETPALEITVDQAATRRREFEHLFLQESGVQEEA